MKLHLKTREHPKGRKPALNNIEATAVAIFKQRQSIATKRSLFEIVEPPCEYNAFVRAINAAGMYVAIIIGMVMNEMRKHAHLIKFTDATDVPVCMNKNAKHHRTMREFASWSQTGKGFFFGLKLHLSADLEDRVLALSFTSANSDDRAVFKKMNAALRGIFVADAGYVSKDLCHDFFIENERMLVTATRSNMKKVAAQWQIDLLNMRMKVETHFRELKVCYGFITSLPRSVWGYLTHYLSAIAAHLLFPRKNNYKQLVSPAF